MGLKIKKKKIKKLIVHIFGVLLIIAGLTLAIYTISSGEMFKSKEKYDLIVFYGEGADWNMCNEITDIIKDYPEVKTLKYSGNYRIWKGKNVSGLANQKLNKISIFNVNSYDEYNIFVTYHEIGHILNKSWSEQQCDEFAQEKTYNRIGWWLLI